MFNFAGRTLNCVRSTLFILAFIFSQTACRESILPEDHIPGLEDPAAEAGEIDTPDSGNESDSNEEVVTTIEPQISFAHSSIEVSSTTMIEIGETLVAYIYLRDENSNLLVMSDLNPELALNGSGTSSGTFGSAIWNSTEKRYESTFTGTVAGTANGVIATILQDATPQAISATAPTLRVKPILGPTVTLAIQTARDGTNSFEASINAERPLTGIDISDFQITGTSAASLHSSGQYLTLTPSNIGLVSIRLNANAGTDSFELGNQISNPLSVGINNISLNVSTSSDTRVNSNPYADNNYKLFGVCSRIGDTIHISKSTAPSTVLATSVCSAGLTWEYSAMGINFATAQSYTLNAKLGDTDATASKSFALDLAPPSYHSLSLPDITDSNLVAYTVSFVCTDDLSAIYPTIASTMVLKDSSLNVLGTQNINCTADGNSNVVFNLASQISYVASGVTATLTVTDSVERTYSGDHAVNVNIASATPSVSISSSTSSVGPYSGNGDTLNFSGTCSEWAGGVQIYFDGSNVATTACSGGSFSSSYNFSTYPAEGNYSVIASQCNPVNGANCSSPSANLFIDTNPNYSAPSVAITASPSDVGRFSSNYMSTMYVSGTCSDSSSGNSSGGNVSIYLNSSQILSSVACTSNQFSISFSTSDFTDYPADGSYNFTATQCHFSDNTLCTSATAGTNVVHAYTAPTVSITNSPATIGQFGTSNWDVIGTCTHNGSGAGGNVSIQLNGSEISNTSCNSSSSTFSATLSTMSVNYWPGDGTTQFTVIQCNAADPALCSSTMASVTVDHYDDQTCNSYINGTTQPDVNSISVGSCQSYSYDNCTSCSYQSGGYSGGCSFGGSGTVCNCSASGTNYSISSNDTSTPGQCYINYTETPWTSSESMGSCWTFYGTVQNNTAMYSDGQQMVDGSYCSNPM